MVEQTWWPTFHSDTWETPASLDLWCFHCQQGAVLHSRSWKRQFPLQFPMSTIAATLKLPILWLCKTHVTVRSIKTKSTQSGGLTLTVLQSFPVDPENGLKSPEVGTRSALKHDKEVSASFYALELLISHLGKQWEEALSAVALCVPLDLILMQIEKGICS